VKRLLRRATVVTVKIILQWILRTDCERGDCIILAPMGQGFVNTVVDLWVP
jgi:hypothetical protein